MPRSYVIRADAVNAERARVDDDLSKVDIARVIEMGIPDPDHLFKHEEIVKGDCIFVASGVTTGPFLRGVRREGDWFHVHSVALRSDSGTIRYVETATHTQHLNLPEDLRLAQV